MYKLKCNSSILVLQGSPHHPKTMPLGLASERVVLLSATTIRCSVATESGKVATWLDELLSHHAAGKLEHPATAFTEFTLDRITSLHTCTLFTVARLDSGALYWWSVPLWIVAGFENMHSVSTNNQWFINLKCNKKCRIWNKNGCIDNIVNLLILYCIVNLLFTGVYCHLGKEKSCGRSIVLNLVNSGPLLVLLKSLPAVKFAWKIPLCTNQEL